MSLTNIVLKVSNRADTSESKSMKYSLVVESFKDEFTSVGVKVSSIFVFLLVFFFFSKYIETVVHKLLILLFFVFYPWRRVVRRRDVGPGWRLLGGAVSRLCSSYVLLGLLSHRHESLLGSLEIGGLAEDVRLSSLRHFLLHLHHLLVYLLALFGLQLGLDTWRQIELPLALSRHLVGLRLRHTGSLLLLHVVFLLLYPRRPSVLLLPELLRQHDRLVLLFLHLILVSGLELHIFVQLIFLRLHVDLVHVFEHV